MSKNTKQAIIKWTQKYHGTVFYEVPYMGLKNMILYRIPWYYHGTTSINNIGYNIYKTHSKSSTIYIYAFLADAFIQSDLQCIQGIHLYCQYVFPGNRTHNLCAANAML